MMAGNPNRWSMNGMHPQVNNSHEFVNYASSNSSSTATADQDFPVRSWSQLLLGGLGGGEEEKYGGSLFQQHKKLENWEDQLLNLNPSFPRININHVSDHHDVKQEVPQSNCQQLYHDDHELIHPNKPSINSWPHHQMMSVSSPNSCVTTLSNNFLNFSGGNAAAEGKNHHHHNQDHSSECNSTSSGGVSKKPRVQQSSPQPALKVRKEKLGDRITALHQLVSPFGKTDTASVLSEAIGYIRFLQGQIEALSSPYIRSGSVSTGPGHGHAHHPQHSVQERSCLFLEEGGQDSQSQVKDLRSRGLCLVPISCTQNVENDNGADYWAPATLGGGF